MNDDTPECGAAPWERHCLHALLGILLDADEPGLRLWMHMHLRATVDADWVALTEALCAFAATATQTVVASQAHAQGYLGDVDEVLYVPVMDWGGDREPNVYERHAMALFSMTLNDDAPGKAGVLAVVTQQHLFPEVAGSLAGITTAALRSEARVHLGGLQ